MAQVVAVGQITVGILVYAIDTLIECSIAAFSCEVVFEVITRHFRIHPGFDRLPAHAAADRQAGTGRQRQKSRE